MTFEFTKQAWEDFEYWIDHDQALVVKVKDVLRSIKENPFKGLGKPEPLKYGLKGFLSRRLTHEHRIVYRISGKKGVDQKCSIIQCRYHYDD